MQKSQSDRPIARLKLAACADAALVWDGTRGFALTDEERDVVSTVVSPEKALTYSRDAPVEGAVVGVWRRGGRGVGRWPNADPVIPRTIDGFSSRWMRLGVSRCREGSVWGSRSELCPR